MRTPENAYRPVRIGSAGDRDQISFPVSISKESNWCKCKTAPNYFPVPIPPID